MSCKNYRNLFDTFSIGRFCLQMSYGFTIRYIVCRCWRLEKGVGEIGKSSFGSEGWWSNFVRWRSVASVDIRFGMFSVKIWPSMLCGERQPSTASVDALWRGFIYHLVCFFDANINIPPIFRSKRGLSLPVWMNFKLRSRFGLRFKLEKLAQIIVDGLCAGNA